jgi:hypothetical protein
LESELESGGKADECEGWERSDIGDTEKMGDRTNARRIRSERGASVSKVQT